MPELPEVETLCRQLKKRVVGQRISEVCVSDPKLASNDEIGNWKIKNVRRVGKTINIGIEDGRCIEIHLRMTGRLLWHENEKILKYTRYRIKLNEGMIDLIDPRRFATVKITKGSRIDDKKDITAKFDKKEFLKNQAGRKISVKALLMDSKALSGIGNIYASEILHGAGILPMRLSKTIKRKNG